MVKKIQFTALLYVCDPLFDQSAGVGVDNGRCDQRCRKGACVHCEGLFALFTVILRLYLVLVKAGRGVREGDIR